MRGACRAVLGGEGVRGACRAVLGGEGVRAQASTEQRATRREERKRAARAQGGRLEAAGAQASTEQRATRREERKRAARAEGAGWRSLRSLPDHRPSTKRPMSDERRVSEGRTRTACKTERRTPPPPGRLPERRTPPPPGRLPERRTPPPPDTKTKRRCACINIHA